ncbi:MAG: xanthine dehydrogenase family protein molybdopterin-binding subunit [Pseudomonadota bacterium]
MERQYVGKPLDRTDALDKVTGRAVYGFDVEIPGMLYGAILRSPFAHAGIVEIDTSQVRNAPGVRAVVTGKDFPFRFGGTISDCPFLATDRVRYVGEPVAAVAADTEREAREALERIRVQYEELPAVFDPREALEEGAPVIHPNVETYSRSIPEVFPGTNLCLIHKFSRGDSSAGFAESDEIFENEFTAHALGHASMETHTAVARHSLPGGGYTLWTSTDRPYVILKELTGALGLSANQVRIVVPYVGGSFGGKNTLVAEAAAVALARNARGRAVKVSLSREEDLTASSVRAAAFMRLKTGVKKDGTLTACSADIVWDNGAYTNNVAGVAIRGAWTIFGPYRIPHLELTSRLVYTNREPSGSYRGYGTTQVTWACESQMDIMARQLGLDPLEFRLKNGYVEGDRYINGQALHGVGVLETMTKAGREIGWRTGNKETASGKPRGRGVASMLKGTLTPTSSCCFIKLNPDATLAVICSVPETGGGQKTVLSQITAETIGVPLASVSICSPDTATTPYNDAVGSSRTTYHMGNAIGIAGREVRGKILGLAGQVLDTDPDLLSLSEGVIFEQGRKARISLKELLAMKPGMPGGAIIGEGHYNPAESPLLEAEPGLKGMSSIFWMFATHAAEVEVDTETGVVTVLKIAAAHDVGRAINPRTCEQQIEGSVIMGLSNTLLEEFRMQGGKILNDSLADYKLATLADIPEIVPIIVEAGHREGPFGAKGIGEPAAAATAPAIANAVFDAVGIRIKDLPITREKILKALKEKNGRQ